MLIRADRLMTCLPDKWLLYVEFALFSFSVPQSCNCHLKVFRVKLMDVSLNSASRPSIAL